MGLHNQLALALAAEQRQADPNSGAQAADLREKLRTVESQLDRLKVQRKEQENLYRLAERQREELKVGSRLCTVSDEVQR